MFDNFSRNHFQPRWLIMERVSHSQEIFWILFSFCMKGKCLFCLKKENIWKNLQKNCLEFFELSEHNVNCKVALLFIFTKASSFLFSVVCRFANWGPFLLEHLWVIGYDRNFCLFCLVVIYSREHNHVACTDSSCCCTEKTHHSILCVSHCACFKFDMKQTKWIYVERTWSDHK